ncbi:MAG: glycosyltransferase family 4 protein, partial [Acidobacteriota bacterium]
AMGNSTEAIELHKDCLALATKHGDQVAQMRCFANLGNTHGSAGRFRDGRRADIVFCWCLNRLSLGPVRAAQAIGIPVCQTINDFHPRQFRAGGRGRPSSARQLLRRGLEQTLVRGTTLATDPFPVALISDALERGLAEEGVTFEDGRVVPQGVPLRNFPFRPRSRKPGDPFHLVYVGQLSRAKGVHTLIRAVALLQRRRNEPVRLRLIGDGVSSYRRELERLCRDSPTTDVEFLGQVDHGEVARRHRQSHVLVFPSEWPEPFGLSHLEAMASGCAVVSTLTGGSAELIEHGVNALAFPAGDHGHLADQLEALADDEDLRIRLVQHARRRVVEHYSLEAYAARLLDFLADVRARAHRSTSAHHPEPFPNSSIGTTS